jgi:hypothetical protein
VNTRHVGEFYVNSGRLEWDSSVDICNLPRWESATSLLKDLYVNFGWFKWDGRVEQGNPHRF